MIFAKWIITVAKTIIKRSDHTQATRKYYKPNGAPYILFHF